ncbi:MAG: hypothetical protein AAGH82_01080 [Pseudomonadota bacterium]
MLFPNKLAPFALGGGAAVLILAATHGLADLQEVKPLVNEGDLGKLLDVANLLAVFFVLALFLERACEVAVGILTAANVLPEDPKARKDPESEEDQGTLAPKAAKVLAEQKALQAKQAKAATKTRFLAAQLLCLSAGLVAAYYGFRLLTMSSDILIIKPPEQATWQRLDIIVTAFVLAGGAKGIHDLIERVLKRADGENEQTEGEAGKTG